MAELRRERSGRGEYMKKNIKKRYLGLDIVGGMSRIDIVVLAVLLMRAEAAIRDFRVFLAIV
jgi:hypothetical protein